MGRVKEVRFGPGSLESVTLRMWRVPRQHESHAARIKANAVGHYTIYCGAGWSHIVDIDTTWDAQINPTIDTIDDLIRCAFDGDETAAESVASELVAYATEDWFDPCETEGDES